MTRVAELQRVLLGLGVHLSNLDDGRANLTQGYRGFLQSLEENDLKQVTTTTSKSFPMP